MTIFSNQRGVSLLLLIIAITVFAGVAIGIVTLLRARYESYPYQVQSYQAYALANGGVEFAIRYIRDNNVDPMDPNSFSQHPEYYIPTDGTYKEFTFGNGKFYLKYVPGCPDMLYSKGTSGTATREVIISNFGRYLGAQGNSVYMQSTAVQRTCYGTDCESLGHPKDLYPGPLQYTGGPSVYSGDRIQISYCVPNSNDSHYNPYLVWEGAAPNASPNIHIAARTISNPAQQVTLGRVGFKDNVKSLPGGVPSLVYPLQVYWIWDATCGVTGDAQSYDYCPGAYNWGGVCPSPSGAWGGLGLVDCVTSNDGTKYTGSYTFPKVPVWDGTSDPPNTLYGLNWNTDQSTSSSTKWDEECRPIRPCDPKLDPSCCLSDTCSGGETCPCLDAAVCTGDTYRCPTQNWPPLNSAPGAVYYEGHYSCFDNTRTCTLGYGGPVSRSRGTCHMPIGSWPDGVPMPRGSQTLSVDLNRIVIETIGHLDAIKPVKFYISFRVQYLSSDPSFPNKPPVTNKFIFTVN